MARSFWLYIICIVQNVCILTIWFCPCNIWRHLCMLYIHSSEIRGLCLNKGLREVLSKNGKIKQKKVKKIYMNLYKYSKNVAKFWSISLSHFIKYKALISEEWIWMYLGSIYTNFFRESHIKVLEQKITFHALCTFTT